MIISHLKHNVENMLAQAKGDPHNQIIQEMSPL